MYRFNSPAPSNEELTRRHSDLHHQSFHSAQRPNFIFDAKRGSRNQLADNGSKNSKLGKGSFLGQQTEQSFAAQNKISSSLVNGLAAGSEHDVSEIVAQAGQRRGRKLAADELVY